MKTHILLIDDDITQMRFFLSALQEVIKSYKCTYASNGIHALKMLFYLRPETIFVDHNMPVMNGLEFTMQLKKIKELQDIPVFLYSDHICPATLQKARELGITGCLEKTATLDNMIIELKKHYYCSPA
ncbi:MAG: response regulator [Chitinophagaceae bacterium]